MPEEHTYTQEEVDRLLAAFKAERERRARRTGRRFRAYVERPAEWLEIEVEADSEADAWRLAEVFAGEGATVLHVRDAGPLIH